MVQEVLGRVSVDEHVMSPLREGEIVRSPGMKYRHYAPQAKTVIYEGATDRVIAAICARYDAATAAGERVAILGFDGTVPHLYPYFFLDPEKQGAGGVVRCASYFCLALWRSEISSGRSTVFGSREKRYRRPLHADSLRFQESVARGSGERSLRQTPSYHTETPCIRQSPFIAAEKNGLPQF